MLVIKSIFYSLKNLLLYREHRGSDISLAQGWEEIGDAKRAITEFMLSGLGLKLADADGLKWIYLTKRQRDAVVMVRKQGYQVAVK